MRIRVIVKNTAEQHLHAALTFMATLHTDMSTNIFYSTSHFLWQQTSGSTVAFRKYRPAMAQAFG